MFLCSEEDFLSIDIDPNRLLHRYPKRSTDLENFCPVEPAPRFQIARSPSEGTVDRSNFWSRTIVINELVLDSLSHDGNWLENLG